MNSRHTAVKKAVSQLHTPPGPVVLKEGCGGREQGREEDTFAHPGEAVFSPRDDRLKLLGSLERGSCWEKHSSPNHPLSLSMPRYDLVRCWGKGGFRSLWFQGRDDVPTETQEKGSEPQSFEGATRSLSFLAADPEPLPTQTRPLGPCPRLGVSLFILHSQGGLSSSLAL